MSYMKKKQKRSAFITIGLLIVTTLVIGAAVIGLLPRTANDELPQTEPPTTVPATTEPTVEAETVPDATIPTEVVIDKPDIRDYVVVELVDGEIQTPYGVLRYPEGLSDHLLIANTCQQPYILEFYAVLENKEELRLFDISLGEESGGNMGIIITPEGDVPLNVTIYTLSTDETWTQGETATVYAMQDAVNDILVQLVFKTEQPESDDPVISPQPDNGGTINNLLIETPYGTLYYPARFATTVRYTNEETQEGVYKVHFYSQIDGREDQLLFSVYFGGDEGEQLGAVMSSSGIPVPVYLEMSALNLDGWDEDEIHLLHSMQEACNELIERLPLLEQ